MVSILHSASACGMEIVNWCSKLENMKATFASLFLLILPFISTAQDEKLDLIVAEKTEDCARMMKQKCYRVQQLPSTEWTLFYDKINGFNYEEGFQYHILVTKTKKPEPVPQDLPRFTFTLDSVISVTPIYSALQHVQWHGQFTGVKDRRFYSLTFTNATTFRVAYDQQEAEVSFTASTGKKKYWKITGFKWISAVPTEKAASNLDQVFRKKIKLNSSNSGTIELLIKKTGKLVFTALSSEDQTRYQETKQPMEYFNGKALKMIQLNGKTVSNSKAEITFDLQAGSFSGNNGCNQMSGRFKQSEGKIQFGNVVSTRMACVDELVNAQEAQLMEILRMENLTVDFAEQVMNIYNPKGELVLMLAVSK